MKIRIAVFTIAAMTAFQTGAFAEGRGHGHGGFWKEMRGERHTYSRQQDADRQAFRGEMRQRKLEYLKKRLAANEQLTEAQKEELLKKAEARFQEGQAFRESLRQETQRFLEGIRDDAGLTPEARQSAIREYFKAQQEKVNAHRAEAKTAWQEFRNLMSGSAV